MRWALRGLSGWCLVSQTPRWNYGRPNGNPASTLHLSSAPHSRPSRSFNQFGISRSFLSIPIGVRLRRLGLLAARMFDGNGNSFAAMGALFEAAKMFVAASEKSSGGPGSGASELSLDLSLLSRHREDQEGSSAKESRPRSQYIGVSRAKT